MARQPRLAVPGLLHYVVLRGQRGGHVMREAADCQLFVEALREACTDVVVHAIALLDNEVHLALRPGEPGALSRAMQAVGRRFVAAYNRRHDRRGSPWDGRFKATVVQPGPWSLAVLCRIERLAARSANVASAPESVRAEEVGANNGSRPPPRWSDPARRRWLVDPPELWALGNTPFEREGAFVALLERAPDPALEPALDVASCSGGALGDAGFVASLSRQVGRTLARRPRGRPRTRSSTDTSPI